MKLEVLKYPNKSLETPTIEVSKIDETLLRRIDEMIDTMYANGGCGLAANQVGYTDSVLVFDCSEDADSPSCMINPKIVLEKGSSVNQEGCLSFPNVGVNILRPTKITVEYLDINGESNKKVFTGSEAICIHHEIDHLMGKTFLDRVNRSTRRMVMRKLRRSK